MFECLDVDPATLTGADLNQQLFKLHADRVRMDAAECRFLADWDARQVWAADGALSGAAWLRNRHGVASRPMRERLRVARRLRSMPSTVAAFTAGDLAYEKVRLLANARTDATAELFDRDEPTLVDSGITLDTDQFSHVMRYWQAMADAAGFNDDRDARHQRRRGWVSETLDGMIKLDAFLDPETGRIVKRVLEEIMDDLYRDDRRDTTNGVGAPERTAQQRLADALAEMARRADTNRDATPRPRTEMLVIVPVETLLDDEPNQTEGDDDTTNPDGATDRDGAVDVDDAVGRDDVICEAGATDGGRSTGEANAIGGAATIAQETAIGQDGATVQETLLRRADATGETDMASPVDLLDEANGTGEAGVIGQRAVTDTDPTTGWDGEIGGADGIGREPPIDQGTATGEEAATGPADVSCRGASAGRVDSSGAGDTGDTDGAGWAGRFGFGGAGRRLPMFDNGVPITQDTVRRLACNGVFRRVVINARSEILDLGRLTADPSWAQRRAVTLRDGGCTFAGCDLPARRCEVHHLIPYRRGSDTGGPTDVHNLTLVCSRHHHLAHEGGFTMNRNPLTGHIETRRPDGTLIPTRPRAGLLDPYQDRQTRRNASEDNPGKDLDDGSGDDPRRKAS